MSWKKKLLRESRLYAIIDKQVLGKSSLNHAAAIISKGGVQIIQLRDKSSEKKAVFEEALSLKKLLAKSKTIFIVNDHADIAKAVNSDGVHLGQDDLPVKAVRKFLGQDKIIGLSCHNIKQAVQAQDRGVDYIAIGPIFSTSTKPTAKAVGLDLIRQCQKMIKVPFFAIGGINENNIESILSCGGARIAVCQAICLAGDIQAAAGKFYKLLH
jgi:thiamine-phosphate pyrophosphorylase